jgi:lipid II:glycine glycyltransferase (peptidoglycan interpeptide bridge formation enzyme)
MKSKTRYNLKLAQRKGVQVIEDSSEKGFEDYYRLTEETTARQKFYAHNRNYHHKMWQTLSGKNGFAHLLKAVYAGETLVTWIIFIVNGIAYYPYGASSDKHRQVMASNLMMWEAIKFARKNNCHLFDLWGATSKNPAPNDPWLGFHRFKEGFGAELVEFVGTFDLIINPIFYWPYRLGESIRWRFLRFLKK